MLCNYDLEIAATNYFHSLVDGEVPLVFHFNGGVYYRDEDGQLQIIQLTWEESTNYRMPIEVWEEMVAAHYPNRELAGGGRARRSSACAASSSKKGCRPSRRRWKGCWTDERRAARRLAALRGLRALPLHAGGDQERDADPARDRLPAGLRGAQPLRPRTRCGSRCVLEHGADATVAGSVRFLQASGERHQGVERGARAAGGRGRAAGRGDPGAGVQLRRASTSCAAGCGCGPSASATAGPGSASASTTRTEVEDDGDVERPVALRLEPALDPRRPAGRRRALRLADRERGAERRGGRRLRERQHLAGAGLARGRRRARRLDVPARPPADRPREPRQPLRQHRDRGGAAAPRPDAERRRSSARSPRTRRCGRCSSGPRRRARRR